jgi:hypothetical protein
MFVKIGAADVLDTLTDDGMIGICCIEVEAVVFTDFKKMERSIKEIQENSESFYIKWCGKKGFMNYLLELIKEEDKFFNKNQRTVKRFKKRYQNFCDDIALYEMMKHVVTGVPMSALVKSHANRDWDDHKNKV